jgi:hypothetical protein
MVRFLILFRGENLIGGKPCTGGQVVFGRAAAQILSSEFRELEPEHKRRVKGVLPVLAPEWRLAKSWYLGCQTVDGGILLPCITLSRAVGHQAAEMDSSGLLLPVRN